MSSLDKRFIKYLIVGLINTLFGYSVYAMLLFLDFHYAIAVFLATILGGLFNFKTVGMLVFENKDNLLLFKFIGVYTVTYLTNIALLKVFATFKIDMFLAGTMLILPLAALSFSLSKKFVFKEHEGNETH